jgi:hypothetical protein
MWPFKYEVKLGVQKTPSSPKCLVLAIKHQAF